MFNDILKKDGDFDRKSLTFLYIIKSLDELKEMGIVEGGQYQMTEIGLKELEGFKPTEEELTEVLLEMKAEGML